MVTVDSTVRINSPDSEQIASSVFGLRPQEIKICHTLMAEEELTINELSHHLDLDRSNIYRYMEHLTELGFITKRPKKLKKGGRVAVYSSRSPEEIRRKFIFGLTAWLEEATELTEELMEEKLAAMNQEGVTELVETPESETVEQDGGMTAPSTGGSATSSENSSVIDRLFSRIR